MNIVRKIVSQDRIRFQEEGYDLDLCYVTPNVVAMSIPTVGVHSVWRNKIDDIRRLLVSRHNNAFLVFNLSEDKYDYDKLNNQIMDFPFPDHHAPPLLLMFMIVNAVDSWIQADPGNVAVVHCKGGKGRTGSIIVAWLMYSGLYPTLDRAARHFAEKRSAKGKGVTQPSQVRCLTYFSRILLNGHAPPLRSFILRSVLVGPIPRGMNINLEIFLYATDKSTLLFSCTLFDENVSCINPDSDPKKYYSIPVDAIIFDDVLIRGSLLSGQASSGTDEKVSPTVESPTQCAPGDAEQETPGTFIPKSPNKLFHTLFYTGFLRSVDHTCSFSYAELDDVKKEIPQDFSLTCDLEALPTDPSAQASNDTFIEGMCATFAARVAKSVFVRPSAESSRIRPHEPFQNQRSEYTTFHAASQNMSIPNEFSQLPPKPTYEAMPPKPTCSPFMPPDMSSNLPPKPTVSPSLPPNFFTDLPPKPTQPPSVPRDVFSSSRKSRICSLRQSEQQLFNMLRQATGQVPINMKTFEQFDLEGMGSADGTGNSFLEVQERVRRLKKEHSGQPAQKPCALPPVQRDLKYLASVQCYQAETNQQMTGNTVIDTASMLNSLIGTFACNI